MSLLELHRVADWLSQFDTPDRYLAEYILRKLRYVSLEEAEKWLQTSIVKLIDDIEKEAGKKEAIAIFPVTKPPPTKYKEDKEDKATNDSSGRIGHILKNLERRLPGHIELSPRLSSMKARKVRHIIFVDDFVGTGDRFIKFWRQVVHGSVKSWNSHGWCKVWVLAFAGHESGARKICNNVRAVKAERVLINLSVRDSFILENRSLTYLVSKYGERLNKSNAKYGYGELCSPIVFQHGCPNNTPGIFWDKGKSLKMGVNCFAGKRWEPLFPERSIPDDLYPIFNEDMSGESAPEEMWMVGHYNLALEFLNRTDSFRRNHRPLLILAMINRGKGLEKIRVVMVLSKTEFESQLSDLSGHGLIDSENKITRFGKDVLKRGTKSKLISMDTETNNKSFFPATFLGFQREV